MERIIIDGLSFSLPLFIMAIGGIYSEKSGITNPALEGLQGVGAFTGAFAAGIDVGRGRLLAVMVSGGLSGLAGISFAYSISANFSSAIYVGYGYLSIAALIFGNRSPRALGEIYDKEKR